MEVVQRRCAVPVSDPAELMARLGRGPFAFLLESAMGPERWARYTFLGTDPREVWRYTNGRVSRWMATTAWEDQGPCANPIQHIGTLMRRHESPPVEGLPRFFGGAVGYIGYDVVRGLEKLGAGPPDDAGFPDAILMIADTVLVLDKQHGDARLIATVDVPDTACPEERQGLIAEAERRLDAWEARLKAGSPAAESSRSPDPPIPRSSYSEDRYLADVAVIKEHIAAGDIFQAVLSRRLTLQCRIDSLALYAGLRAANPSPYLYYLNLDGFCIVGSSPEVLVRVEDREITVRPIAGTRPRGATPAEDDALGRELLADPKELAEHAMLVDLGRNDVGRVSEYGSVRVVESRVLERYQHVQHIVSEVRGTLRSGLDAIDALAACFPAGTVTGAPKVRAMEIIDSLEPERRGPYAGAVGYIGWGARQLDTAITIRTCVVYPDLVLVQAGAGIVADSDPVRELAETGQKSQSALQAVASSRRANVR